ncbi:MULTISPECIES: TetR/AcrR family transcriptional regulator [unclassified Pseudofrankia]|uniref:TetR/AcrR family transcriptional regulator n=1 Tax=unclassified Pseudofrankia TaxID=2994372 RepID=UPI0012FF6E28|nr:MULTISPECIES: TetR/AcrR family transcriptional regulator [unclassified Pseudofrankia]MDT3446853.1 helix-turn-helix domain-containing protein [Pseudofrankia sp. BMG5.37]
MLDAARRLFGSNGYEGTSIDDIVRESGVSVGSIYHQFGGKSEVFMTLVESALARHSEVSARETRRAINAGETDPLRIYIAGAKAYLMETWKQRDLDRISFAEDGPPGFATFLRERHARYLRGSRGLTIGKPPLPDSTAHALTALLLAAATQLVDVNDRRTAKAVVDYFTNLILRMGDQD